MVFITFIFVFSTSFYYNSQHKDIDGEILLNLKTSLNSGRIHISVCNLDPENPAQIACRIEEKNPKNISGRVLTADAMNAHNTFENPQYVKPTVFKDFRLVNDVLKATLPAKSVTVLEIE